MIVKNNIEFKTAAAVLATNTVLNLLEHTPGIHINIVSNQRAEAIINRSIKNAELMGSRVNARKSHILANVNWNSLTKDQRAIATAFATDSSNERIQFSASDGKKVSLVFKQGNEDSAGIKHALFRHYTKGDGNFDINDMLCIPEIASKAKVTRYESGRNVYKYNMIGLTFTLLTYNKNGKEEFGDFYTNKKAPVAKKTKGAELNNGQQSIADGKNTLLSAPQYPIVDTKVQQYIDTTKRNPEKFISGKGVLYGFAIGNNIYLTQSGINPETPIHEYTHLWAKAMQLNSPDKWENIKDLLRNTPAWDEVAKDEVYSAIHQDDNAIAREALSRISGRANSFKLVGMAERITSDGPATRSMRSQRTSLVGRMKTALSQFWGWVGKDLLHLGKFSSIAEVSDRVLSDLLNKTNLKLGRRKEMNPELMVVNDKISHVSIFKMQDGSRAIRATYLGDPLEPRKITDTDYKRYDKATDADKKLIMMDLLGHYFKNDIQQASEKKDLSLQF